MALDKLTSLFKEETVEISQEERAQIEKEHQVEDDTFKIETPQTGNVDSTSRSFVRVYTPVTKSIVTSIIDSLKRGELVLVNLSRLPEDEGQYILSTLSGSMYSLDGEIQMISDYVMLCAPQKFIVEADNND